jgi:hypothetical protein
MTDDVRKLLGGYATGTLSDEEKQFLFDAALQDDELFAALADEQALKELLDDTTVRAQILRATEEPRFSVMVSLRDWFERPKAKALVATGAVLLAVIGVNTMRQAGRNEQVAQVREPTSAVAPLEPKKAPQTQPKQTPVKRTLKSADATPAQAQADQNAAPVVAQAPPPPPPSAPVAGVVGGLPGPSVESAAKPLRLADEARSAVHPVRYEILRKEANGEFRPVPMNYEFTGGDVIRLRVTSARSGAVAVSAPSLPVISGLVVANRAMTLPETDGIVVTSDTDKLVLSFAAQPDTHSDFTTDAVPRPARGVAAGAVSRASEAGAPTLTIEIPIRHHK